MHAEISYTDIAAGAGQFGIQTNVEAIGAAIGGAVAENNLSSNQVTAYVNEAWLSADDSIDVSARTGMATDGVVLGLAVGGDGANDVALGGSVVANTVKPTTEARVTGSTTKISAGGDISIAAEEVNLVVSSGAGVISVETDNDGGAAIGAAVATNTVDSTVSSSVVTAPALDPAPSIISYGGKVNVTAHRDDPQIVAVALGGEAAQNFAAGGSVATNTVTHTTDAHVSGGTEVSGHNGVTVEANEDSPVIVAAAGNFDISNKGVAVGAAVPTNTITRSLTAYVGDQDQADFDTGADGASLTSSAGEVKVAAIRDNSLVLAIGVSGVGAEKFSLGGSVVESNIKSSIVDAHVWGGTLDGTLGVSIEAEDTDAANIAFAGNVDLSLAFSKASENGDVDADAIQAPPSQSAEPATSRSGGRGQSPESSRCSRTEVTLFLSKVKF